VENICDLIWSFYTALKSFKQRPSPGLIAAFSARFERIFSICTGCAEIDKLLARLLRQKHKLLKVLEHPEVPLHTNVFESDLRKCAIKRKISGGTMSRDGRAARDTVLGLMKTCKKLGLSFWHFLGDRLMTSDHREAIPLALPTHHTHRDHLLVGTNNCPAHQAKPRELNDHPQTRPVIRHGRPRMFGFQERNRS